VTDQPETRPCGRTKDHPAHQFMLGRKVQRCLGSASQPEQSKTAAPEVAGRCPACRGASLFVGSGGHVTCARLDCPNPIAADDLLHAPTGPLVTGTLAQLAGAVADLAARLDDHVNAVRKAVL